MPESLNSKPVQLLSVVIPARDEEGSVGFTVEELHNTLRDRGIPHEIVVVNDGSRDGTWALLQDLSQRIPTLRPVNNTGANGFGRARDLPWKVFPAKLIQDARANVVPVYFSGQNGRLFHLVSGPMNMAERDNRVAKFIGKASLTLRTSLLIR